jgi:hypothetical protein
MACQTNLPTLRLRPISVRMDTREINSIQWASLDSLLKCDLDANGMPDKCKPWVWSPSALKGPRVPLSALVHKISSMCVSLICLV